MIDYSYLAIQNPWWDDPGSINQDEKLIEFEASKYKYLPQQVLNLKFRPGDVNIITGPRQTGKSTAVKLYLRRLLKNGFPAESILFFNCDALSSQKDLTDLVMEFIGGRGAKSTGIFLDEVTSVASWPQAIKWLADAGLLKHSTLFLTGSSSISLKKHGEFLPGRRGRGADIVFLPLTFGQYLNLVGIKTADQNFKHSAKIKSHFEDYLLTGGLLRNINYGAKANISLYLATLRSELFKNGKKEDFLREVVRKLLNSLSSQTSYTNIAEEAELGSKNTAIDYLSFLADSYFLAETKFYDINQRRLVLKKNKKYYTVDPYFIFMFSAFVYGEEGFATYQKRYDSPAEKAKLVENFIASELVKSQAEFYFYQNSRELDFILPKNRLAIEVKYKHKITSQDLKPLQLAAPGYRKILVSKNTLAYRQGINIIPAHLAAVSHLWPSAPAAARRG